MAIETISIKVDATELANGLIRFYVGNFGYAVLVQDLKELIVGRGQANLNLDHLLRNVAISASLAGKSLSDLPGLKTWIESQTFKV